ncbi:MAG: M28 family peptidase [Gemmatimonadaceae bacterium]
MTVAGDDAELALQARKLLEKIAAAPRFAGSSSEARARAFCAELLRANGFAVIENQIQFSEFTGKWAVPILSLLLAAASLLINQVYYRHGGALPALTFFAFTTAVIIYAGRWLGGRGTTAIPWLRSHSANLVATRGEPSVWLVAHLDSKSQTLPMLARIVAIVLSAVLTIFIMALLIAVVAGAVAAISIAAIVAKILALALVPLIFCFTGDRSPGAADNASGAITVLLALRAMQSRENLGVILTTGEELALVGARAFVRTQSARGIAINCDTIDDNGRFRCMIRGERGVAVASMLSAAERLGFDVPVTSILPGILTDGIAFSDAGWDCVTLSHGNIATLARVHTSRDTREKLDGTGIAKATRLIVATIEELS